MPPLYKMYVNKNTVIEHMSVITKTIWLFLVYTSYLFMNKGEYALVYLMWGLIPFILARLYRGWRLWFPLTLATWSIIVGIVVWSAFYPYGTPILKLGSLIVTDKSLSLALGFSLRALAALFTTITFLSTTKQGDLIRALEFYRVPSWGVMGMTLSLRFIPIYMGMTQQVQEAQRARAFTINRGPIIRRIKAIGWNVKALIVPVMHSLMKTVGEVSLCLDSKGWVVTQEKRKFDLKISTIDKIFIVVNIVIFIMFLTLKSLGWSWIPMQFEIKV